MSDLDDFFPGAGGVKTNTPEVAQDVAAPTISPEAKAEVRAAAAHVRQRATHSARLAHQNAAKAASAAKVLSGSLRDRAVTELGKPIAWVRVGKAAVGPIALIVAITAGMMFRDQHRASVAKDEAKAAEVMRVGANSTPANRTAEPPVVSAHLPPQALVAVASPTAPVPASPAPVAVPATAPVPAQPVVVASPLIVPQTPPASSIAVLPVPGNVSSGTCAFGLPTLLRLQKEAAVRALSSEENGWVQFGYACVGAGFIAFTDGAFSSSVEKATRALPAAVEKQPPEAKARVSSSNSRENVRATRGSSNAQKSSAGVAALETSQRISPSNNTCALHGAVVSQDNTPLAGATVSITGLGINATGTTTTDSNGGFTFAGLPTGQVSVNVEANKHFTQKATLQTCGGSLTAPIRLETCNFLTCKARQLDQRLGLGRH